MGMSRLRGRDFDEHDNEESTRVAMVSEELGQQLWPGLDPIGRSLAIRSEGADDAALEWLMVVGVVNNVRTVLNEIDSRFSLYVPLAQQPIIPVSHLIVRTTGSGSNRFKDLRELVASAASDAEVFQLRSMGQIVNEILYPRRLATVVVVVSSLLAALLTCVGTYGVVAYSIAERVHEYGVRMALGARRRHIISSVLREAVQVTVLGSAVGVVLATVGVRAAGRVLVGVPALDPTSVAASIVVLTAVILLSCYVPAHRAASVQPAAVLRRS
jgi:putative ABC transport system permease protein